MVIICYDIFLFHSTFVTFLLTEIGFNECETKKPVVDKRKMNEEKVIDIMRVKVCCV